MKFWQIMSIIGVAFLVTSCFPTPIPTATPTTDIKITSPTEGAKIDQTETVKGSSQVLPGDTVIWVVVFLPTVGGYFPQNNPVDLQANGDWSSVVYIGQTGESGLKADIIAVLADKGAQDAFNTYLKDARDKNDYPGLERLPDGATIFHRISVTRK